MAEVPAEKTATSGPISRARASLAALETLQRLRQAPHTAPSPDDLAALRGWSGWGPLAPALEANRSGTWEQIGERIAYLLPREHYDHGIQAAYSAFYTPPQVATACWDILTGLGFAGGTALEPGCGAGVFMSHTPADMAVRWTGVERDPTTAAIAGLLNPGATIHSRRLEETALPSRSVDAVLGNVPFGDTQVYDPTAPRQITANLHNYFIWRSIQALRPGGVAVLLTSRYTLDAAGETAVLARNSIAWDADLLGAIRLPNSALAPGGTEALVDILVLRRRRADEPRPEREQLWCSTRAFIGDQHVNAYLLENPAMILGALARDHAPQYGRTLRVDALPQDPPLASRLAQAGRDIVADAERQGLRWRVDAGPAAITAESAPFALREDGRKEGSFHLIDGTVHEVIDAQLVKVERPGEELPRLIALRNAVLSLLDAETDHAAPDTDLEPLRAEANRRYDAYVTAHGYLNRYTVVEGNADEDGIVQVSRRRPSMGGFRRDPDFVTVLALEDFDDDTCTAAKAALLTRRVNRPRERATHADSPAEAIALCRDELGRLDLGRVAELLGVEKSQAEQHIADVAFLDPATDSWVPADEYLTGNVRAKLATAQAAATGDPERFGRNVPALEDVIPADLQPEQIVANLGAAWIPAGDVQEFAQELLGFRLHIWHEPRTSTWSVRTSKRAEESATATTEWGTGRFNAYQLLEYGLNGKAPVVYDFIDDKRVRNQDDTLAACDRLEAIANRFSTWVWEDPDRADRLAHAYNQTFNAVVPRRFDGAHLTFPGLDPEFDPYPHQRDMVARMISGADALCPFPVGTGKTATMFMAAIKLKALGLAAKPMITVVPSTLEQIARDGKRLFPNARILMAGKEDLANARARKLFAARCAMEDWDAVVMSHPSFTSMPVHPTVQADYVAGLASEYRAALISAKSDGAEPRKIKQIAKMVDRLEADAKALMDHATDDGVFFEHLGVDYLLVDEMHYFKNLGVPVHTDGFAVNGSKRAQDLDMKLGWLRQRNPDHAVVTGFTGTPVSNTLLEAFIIQHYLQPERLAELGLESADAWAATFVRFATAVEVTPDGGFKLNRRPAEIVNIPELMNTLGEFAELRPSESFPVKRPDVRRHNVAIEASDAVRDFVRSLAERADDIHAGGVPPSIDNILKICSDGRKVALHESLVGLEPDGPGKVGALVENVARTYHETKDLRLPDDGPDTRGALQLVFCDLGTPNKDKGSQIYGRIRRQLVRAGVPAERIRFIHEATTDARRLVLFDQCNKGEVSVLLGSTDKLGVGVNIQRRAVALHHVDAPWRPDQVEQRDGRVWRPKNLNSAVDIYRYVTEGSFDAFMWQALERKEKALRPILSGQATARSVEDIGDVALDYGQIKAISTGNPLLTELNEVAFEVKRLSSLATSHQRAQRRLRADIQTLTMQASAAATTADALETVAQTAAQNPETTPWRDTRGNPIPDDDLPAVLTALAESTAAKGYCNDTVQWRGLTIDFTATKQWRETELAARVTTAGHRIDVPLKAAWTAKGQHWRLRDAITAAIGDAHQTAAATHENITVLRQRIVENNAALGQPFADADALDAARAHRAALELAIREQAQKDEQARRARASRAASAPNSASTQDDPDAERHALLRRLHAALATVVERAPVEWSQATQEAAEAPNTSHEMPTGSVPVTEPDDAPITSVTPADDRADGSTRPTAPGAISERSDEQDRQPDVAATTIEKTAKDEPGLALDVSAKVAQPGATPEPEPTPEDSSSAQTEVPAPAEPAEPAEPHDEINPADGPSGTEADFVNPAAAIDMAAIASEEADTVREAAEPEGAHKEPAALAGRETTAPRRREPTRPRTAPTPTPTPTPEVSQADELDALPSPSAPKETPNSSERQQRAQLPAEPTAATPTETRPASRGQAGPRPAARPSPPVQRSPQFEHAVDLALQGFAVFPLRPGTKAPLVKDWEKAASTDPRQIALWWTDHPHANIAIACGPSNLLVIDLDTAKQPGECGHGQQTLTTLAAGREIPRTFTVGSARGGRHLYYRQPGGVALRNTTGSDSSGLGPLIDTRGHGGYIVAPGSTFAGGTYRIERDAPVAPLPTWIVRELETRQAPIAPAIQTAPLRVPVPERRRTAYGSAAMRRSADTVATAPEGARNHSLNREAFRLGRLVGGGILNRDDAATTLRRAARKAGLPPHEIEKTIASGLTAGIARPLSVPDRTPASQTNRTTKEVPMSTTTTDTPQAAGPAAAAPPNPADLYPRLSEPGSRAFQDALRTLWRLGPTAIGLPETITRPVRAAWQEAGEQMAAAIQEHEAAEPSGAPGQIPVEAVSAPTPEPATTLELESQTEAATSPAADFDFEEVWADVRATIERARQALPDAPSFSTFDDVQQAITGLRSALAETPVSLRGPANNSGPAAPAGMGTDQPANVEQTEGEALAQDPVEDLDEHLAAVDAAYAEARSAGIPTTRPEWAGIRAIHTAVHNLWDTVKAAAATYWTELAADARVHGVLATLATRAARAIANLAHAAADRLQQRTSQQSATAAPSKPGLREAYINARNQVRAHAASHEWQRITALWGTVNTLTRQTDDPGIRAVVARSADAISDYADTLSRKTTRHGSQDCATGALNTLARAAERHAATLRGTKTDLGRQHQTQVPAQVATNAVQTTDGTPRPQQSAEAQALQARARQVAQHAQARIGEPQRMTTSAPRRSHNNTNPHGQGAVMRPMQPTAPRESANTRVR